MGVFVVTGAASGIGLATAQRLYRAGHGVWCLDRDAGRLGAAFPELVGSGIRSLTVDVSDDVAMRAAFDVIGSKSDGRLNGLVNSAGVVPMGAFDDLSVADWELAFRVNVIGSYLAIRYSTPLLRSSGGGSIVNLASMAAKLAGPYTAPYNASKAAVISLTRTAATCLAPSIRVNAVCPGVVSTPAYEMIDATLISLGAPSTLQSVARAASAPIGRPASSDEVATVIEFLLSEAAAYITGEDVNVTGGFVMH